MFYYFFHTNVYTKKHLIFADVEQCFKVFKDLAVHVVPDKRYFKYVKSFTQRLSLLESYRRLGEVTH